MTVRELLARHDLLDVALVSGPAAALAAEDLSFDALMVGGGVSAFYEFAVQDGLITPGEVIEQVRRVRGATDMPIIADLDDVGGVPPYVRRYVRAAEDAGADAFVIEDIDCLGRWQWSESAGAWDYNHQRLRSPKAAADLVKAAVDPRRKSDTVVIARTDAFITESMDAALERSELFVQAGADVVMIIGITADSAPQASERLSVPLAGLVDLESGAPSAAEYERLRNSAIGMLVYFNGLADEYVAATNGLGQATVRGRASGAVPPAADVVQRIGAPIMVHDAPD